MSVFVKALGAWHEIMAAPAGLPGLGGWADVTVVTGAPTKHEYTDADGNDWTAYEFKANGSVTLTEGLVEALLVSGGGATTGDQRKIGAGGSCRQGVIEFAAGTFNVVIGTGGVDRSGANTAIAVLGKPSTIGSFSSGFSAMGDPTGPCGGALDQATWTKTFDSDITGTLVQYGGISAKGVHPTPNTGWATFWDNQGGIDGATGVVVVRVPRANAKA